MAEAAKPVTATQMRGQLAAMLKKHDLDPLEELIIYAKNAKTPRKEKKEIYKFLTPYVTPTLKSVDLQADHRMNVTVQMQSFGGATQRDVRTAEMVDESEYDDFIDLEDNGTITSEQLGT